MEETFVIMPSINQENTAKRVKQNEKVVKVGKLVKPFVLATLKCMR